MKSETTKFGIRDFFSAFRTDKINGNKRANISDLKPIDWATVSKEVKEELSSRSQNRIKKIEETLGAIKEKIRDTLGRTQANNNNYGVVKKGTMLNKEDKEIVH